jgi:gliding motility-associated protein GldM
MKEIISLTVLTILTFINIKLFAQTDNIAVVSADTMNVLYIGIDNPISIAVPGINNDKIKVSINNGTITGSNGKYIVKVDKVVETIIEVTAEIKPGEISKAGSRIFRVKRIPDVIRCIGNYCTTTVNLTKDELLTDPTINVSMNLPFDPKIEVVSFTATFSFKGELKSFSISGNKFNREIIDYVKQLKLPDKLYIEDIKVKIFDGTTRIVQPIKIRLIENDNKEKQ